MHDDLPQGSLLAPLFFTADITDTATRKLIYADDIALVYQHKDFRVTETTLNDDLTAALKDYFTTWKPNP